MVGLGCQNTYAHIHFAGKLLPFTFQMLQWFLFPLLYIMCKRNAYSNVLLHIQTEVVHVLLVAFVFY